MRICYAYFLVALITGGIAIGMATAAYIASPETRAAIHARFTELVSDNG